MNRTIKGTLARTAILFLLLVACAGCSPNVTHQIHTEIQYRERLVPIVASVNIPYFVERNVTKDTTSHLENPFARSDARISDGLLFHTLESIPQTIETLVYVPVTDTLWKDSDVITKEVPVEKNLSWSQKAKIDAFPWLMLAVIGLLLWTFRKRLF